MNFVDSVLVRLADPATRAGVFDEAALAQIASAAYDTDATPLEGPYTATFDDFRLGLAVPPAGLIEGVWTPVGSGARVEARFNVSGLGNGPLLRVDALWRGRIVARTVPASGRIAEVRVIVPDVGTIDAEIVAALGALPADPAVLEAERRARLLARLRAGASQPDAVDEDAVDDLLRRAGAGSVGALLAMAGGAPQPLSVRVRYEPIDAGPPAPRPLPVAAALLIRDAGSFSLAQLLMESALVRERMIAQGVEMAPDPRIRPRRPVVAIWVLEPTVFDDADWPGASADARRAAAGVWLAREGIGLVVPP